MLRALRFPTRAAGSLPSHLYLICRRSTVSSSWTVTPLTPPSLPLTVPHQLEAFLASTASELRSALGKQARFDLAFDIGGLTVCLPALPPSAPGPGASVRPLLVANLGRAKVATVMSSTATTPSVVDSPVTPGAWRVWTGGGG